MPNKPPLYKPTRPAAQFGLRQETERKLRKVAGVIMPATFRASEQYMRKHPSKHLPDQSAAVLADWSLSGKDVAVPSPPSRPQAKQRCVSISGSGAKAPAGAGQSPAARRAGAGCRAEPCRSPRRRGVQGQRPAARRAGAGCRGSAPAGSPEGGALGGGGGKLLGKIRFSRFLIKLSLYSVETLGFDGFLTLFCCEF